MIKVHRGEAKYTPMTDLQWTSTETKSSQKLNNSPFHSFTAVSRRIQSQSNDQWSYQPKPLPSVLYHWKPIIEMHTAPPLKFLVTKVHFFFFHGPCARITQKSPCWNPNQFSRIPEPGSRLTGCYASQPEAKPRIPANQLGLHVNNTRKFLHKTPSKSSYAT